MSLAQFWGVKDADGRLLAMAGERLRLPGMSEVSGVCTHPDTRGQGLGSLLSHHVASEIVRRGEVPFLHAYANNARAIRLYERLGFALRCEMEALVVRQDLTGNGSSARVNPRRRRSCRASRL